MDRHVAAVAALFIAFGAVGVCGALIVLVTVVGGGGGLSIAGPLLLIAPLKIVGGIALLQRRPWARILVLVLSFLSLIMFPIGTAYGVYAIWVLMKDDTLRLLAPAADAQ